MKHATCAQKCAHLTYNYTYNGPPLSLTHVLYLLMGH